MDLQNFTDMGYLSPHDFSCGARLSFAFIVWSSMVCSTSLGYFNGSNALPYLWWWCWKLFECLFLNLAIWDDDAILPLVADFVLRVDLCCSGLLHRTSCLPDVVGPNIGRLLNARSCMPKAIQVHPKDTQTPKRYCAIHFLKDLTHIVTCFPKRYPHFHKVGRFCIRCYQLLL